MFVLISPLCTRRSFSSVMKVMKKHEVVPDVIDEAPDQVVEVSYPSGVKVNLGNVLTPTQVKDMPTVKWKVEKNALYTVCMIDPDAPSREEPKFREWNHWLVGNVFGSNIKKGEALAAYLGSGPPAGTGLHRYIFLVYKQSKKLRFNEKHLTNRSGDGRAGFSIRKFAGKYKLNQPVAGNVFLAEYDDYVPIFYKQLGA